MLAVISCSKIILRKETTVKKNDNGLGSLVRGGGESYTIKIRRRRENNKNIVAVG